MPEGSEVELAGHATGGGLRIKRKFGVYDNAKTLLSGIAGGVRKRWCW